MEPTPAELELIRVRVGDHELLVLSHPRLDQSPLLDGLTAAQREVILLAADGLTNREIAERRATAESTVAKLRRQAYERLGVSSTPELLAALSGGA